MASWPLVVGGQKQGRTSQPHTDSNLHLHSHPAKIPSWNPACHIQHEDSLLDPAPLPLRREQDSLTTWQTWQAQGWSHCEPLMSDEQVVTRGGQRRPEARTHRDEEAKPVGSSGSCPQSPLRTKAESSTGLGEGSLDLPKGSLRSSE